MSLLGFLAAHQRNFWVMGEASGRGRTSGVSFAATSFETVSLGPFTEEENAAENKEGFPIRTEEGGRGEWSKGGWL